MDKKLIIKLAVGAAVLAGTGFGIYKLYQKKKEPNEVIDISEPEPEKEPEAPTEEVEVKKFVEEPESDEDEDEGEDDDDVETDEYEHYYDKWR